MRNLLFLLITILFFSCAGETNYETYIENDSNQDVIILLYNNGFPRGDSLRISANSRLRISLGESSSAEEEEPDCAERIDSAYSKFSGGGTLGKDISRGENWVVDTDQTQNIPRKFEHVCTFEIRDSDIVE